MPVSLPRESLISLLRRGTDSGRLRWEQTVDENAFRMVLSTGMVRLAKVPGTMLPDAPASYLLQVFDQKNNLIETFEPKDDQEMAALRDLYDKARREALDLDHALEAVVKELMTRVGSAPS